MTDECPFYIKIPFKDENPYYYYFCTKIIERWKHKDKTKTTINMMDESERVRRTHRKGSYHLVASKNKLPTDEYEQEEDYLFQYLLSQQVPHPKKNSANIKAAKQTFLQELALSGGDTSSSATGVRQALENLLSIGSIPHSSATSMSQLLEGMRVSLSKPIFTDCLGVNHAKEHLYSLGRMSFGTSKLKHARSGGKSMIAFPPDTNIVLCCAGSCCVYDRYIPTFRFAL